MFFGEDRPRAEKEDPVTTPALCENHHARVGNFFDTALAFRFQIDAEGCLICREVIQIQEARRYLSQPHSERREGPPDSAVSVTS